MKKALFFCLFICTHFADGYCTEPLSMPFSDPSESMRDLNSYVGCPKKEIEQLKYKVEDLQSQIYRLEVRERY